MAGLYELTELLGITGIVVKTIFAVSILSCVLFGLMALQQGQFLTSVLMIGFALGGGVILGKL